MELNKNINSVKTCPKCNTENPLTANFCRYCRYEFPGTTKDGIISKDTPLLGDYDPNNVPKAIKNKKWNWGAFVFTWLWGLGNRIWWPLFLEIFMFLGCVTIDAGDSITLWICGIIEIAMRIMLGINGNKWAWENKYWASLKHFKRVQHNWAIASYWFLGVLGFLIFIGLLLAS